MSDAHRWNVDRLSHDELREQVTERYGPLFEPIRIGPKVAPNRFFSVPYSSGWGMEKIRLEVAHRGMRAEGGWGVVSTGECAVVPEGVTNIIPGLELFDDADTLAVGQIADKIHEHGSLAAIELLHPGTLASPTWSRLPAVGPTHMQSDALFFSSGAAQGMTVKDILRTEDAFESAARRGRAAGFDIVYVHCAHAHLPMQFLTPYYNHRTDAYGGSLENRARFLLETLEKVRAAIGEDTAVACRFAIEGLGLGGLPIDEALEVMRMSDHLVDVWDLAIGGLTNADRDLTPSRLYPEGASLEWTRRAKEATGKPVVGSGRFTDVDLMLRVINSGELDFVGAARPGIADPFLPRKIATGQFRRIRECVGSNRCAFSQVGGMMACSQNATTGEEYRRGWHPERFTRAANADQPVLIVGAGPAGMECATALARRGFENVHIVDAAEQLGGNLRWFTKLPGFAAWGHVIEHRKLMIDDLQQIQFVPSKPMGVDDVIDYGGAIVIIATGAPWSMLATDVQTGQPVGGADASMPHVLTPEQLILGGKQIPGKRVLVYDCEAELTALGVAQYLQDRDHDVEFASPFADIAFRAHQDGVSFALRGELAAAGAKLHPSYTLTKVEESGATFMDGDMREVRVDCDAVVMLTVRMADDSLYHELAGNYDRLESAGIRAVYRIGDCVAPQNLSEALFSGHRLAREIDAEDPEVPLLVPRN